jgi:hypothetical protein
MNLEPHLDALRVPVPPGRPRRARNGRRPFAVWVAALFLALLGPRCRDNDPERLPPKPGRPLVFIRAGSADISAPQLS